MPENTPEKGIQPKGQPDFSEVKSTLDRPPIPIVDPRRKTRIVLVILGVVILVSLATLIFFRVYNFDRDITVMEIPVETVVRDVDLPETPDMFPDDADRDGITNSEEQQMGLNPVEHDTDRDGISDGEEIEKWKTDPLKTDTDGDGYADGFEVLNGFDPLGDGELRSVE